MQPYVSKRQTRAIALESGSVVELHLGIDLRQPAHRQELGALDGIQRVEGTQGGDETVWPRPVSRAMGAKRLPWRVRNVTDARGSGAGSLAAGGHALSGALARRLDALACTIPIKPRGGAVALVELQIVAAALAATMLCGRFSPPLCV